MAEPLDVLIKAIVAKCVGTPAIANLGPISRKEKRTDKETITSYIVIDEVGDSDLLGTTCENEYWDHNIEFKLYSTSPEACAAMATTFKGIFDSDSLALSLSEGSVRLKRAGSIGYVKADKTVWYASVKYRFETSKPRTA